MENTTENNKLIAEFMGITKHKINANGIVLNFENSKYNTYHKDWNWLMEVVDKIYEMDLYYDKYIDYNSSMFSNGKITLGTRIDRVYEQVVEFVKWYNQQKSA